MRAEVRISNRLQAAPCLPLVHGQHLGKESWKGLWEITGGYAVVTAPKGARVLEGKGSGCGGWGAPWTAVPVADQGMEGHSAAGLSSPHCLQLGASTGF